MQKNDEEQNNLTRTKKIFSDCDLVWGVISVGIGLGLFAFLSPALYKNIEILLAVGFAPIAIFTVVEFVKLIVAVLCKLFQKNVKPITKKLDEKSTDTASQDQYL